MLSLSPHLVSDIILEGRGLATSRAERGVLLGRPKALCGRETEELVDSGDVLYHFGRHPEEMDVTSCLV